MTEPFRPLFHFSPQENWMNDPNGLVYNDGIYHLYYQYYPEDIVWGPMHWGHATSKDLITWEHQPVALYPDSLGYIFSGSAVVDENNTSGFGEKRIAPLVAAYTYHNMDGEKGGRLDYQTQGIAYSLDNGQTFTKYDDNPMIPNPTSIKDFRDPKVFWHAPSKEWKLVLVAGDHMKLYGSPNLKNWTLLSEFGKETGAHGGVWECPDLFPLTIPGTTEKKWVLLISINPGAINGGSGTQYFVGDFDGTTFTTDQNEVKWIDYGRDNYAGVTYNNVPDNRRLFIGWMSNWDYAQETPTEKWRSSMTLPRALTLEKIGTEVYLKSSLIKEFSNYLTKEQPKASTTKYDLAHVQLKVPVGTDYLDIKLSNQAGNDVFMVYSKTNSSFSFDRMKSGKNDFSEKFTSGVQSMPLPKGIDVTNIQLIIDRSSVEVLINDGLFVMTNQLFPDSPFEDLSVNSEGGKVTVIESYIQPGKNE